MPWVVNVTEFPINSMTAWRDTLVWTNDPCDPCEEIIAQSMDNLVLDSDEDDGDVDEEEEEET